MKSIGVVFKKEEMTMVSLRQGIRDIFLEGYRSVPFLDFNEEEKEEAILLNIDQFLKTYRGARDNLFIGLPRDCAFLRFLQLPLALEENLQATLGYEMDRHTPYSFDDVYFDYHVVERLTETNVLSVMLVVVQKNTADYYLNLLKKLKVKPRGIELITTGLFNALHCIHTPAEKMLDPSVLLAHPVVKKYVSGSLVKRFPKAARFMQEPQQPPEQSSIDVLVEYLDSTAYELSIANRAALLYSKTFSFDPNDTARHFQDIHEQALKGIIHLPFDPRDAQRCLRIFLAGKELDAGYEELIPEPLRASFSVLHNTPVRLDSTGSGSITPALPLLAAPTGLALKGLQTVSCNINFIPVRLRPRKKRSKRKILAAAGVFLLLFLSAASLTGNIIKLKTRQTVLTAQVNELKLAVEEIEKLQQEAAGIEQFSAAINSIREKGISQLSLLEELTTVIPEDSWVRQYDYFADKHKVRLYGYADSASKLIPILEESLLFEKVKFTSPITTDRRQNKEKFRIEFFVTTK